MSTRLHDPHGMMISWRLPTRNERLAPLIRRIGGLALLVCCLLGAGPLEVREVRVPAARVTSYFPAGTPLRIMPETEFRDLLERARAGADRLAFSRSPALLRADHRLRWEANGLEGRSELTIEARGTTPALLPLEPWTPAIRSSQGSFSPRSLEDGRTVLLIDRPGVCRSTLHWSARARPGSRSRVFDLALPAVAISSLELSLPEGLEPEINHAWRIDSQPEDEEGRRLWRFEGVSGVFTLHLRSVDRSQADRRTASAWVSGPTRVELLDASASFEADWTVDLAPGAARTLQIELDPGLRFTRLDGPDVIAVQMEPDGEATRVQVELADSVETSTQIRLHALGPVPDEGRWQVPSARPLGADWTGGRTLVWIGPNRVVENQTPRAGWLVPASVSEKEVGTRGGQLFVYESQAPRSVAEFDFRAPSADGSVSIRGVLNVSAQSPTMQATLTWQLDHGPLLAIPIDLPAGWVPDSVQVLGLDEPTSWRLEHRDGTGLRIVVQPPPYLDPQAPVSIQMTAEASGQSAQTVRVPRLRPGFGRVSDDLWAVSTVPDASIQPQRARGLAWVDPLLLGTSTEAPASEHPSLAWRWTEPDGELVLRFLPASPRVSGECWTRAEIHADRVDLDWYVWLKTPSRALSSVVLRTSLPLDQLPEWFVSGDESGLPRDVRRLDESERQALRIAPDETAFRVALPLGLPGGQPVVLHARLSPRPSASIGIPFVRLPSLEHARGCVLISVDDTLQTTASAQGLVETDRSSALDTFRGHFASSIDLKAADGPKQRLAQAFDYASDGGELHLKAERMAAVEADGFLSEAILSSLSQTGSVRQRRLILRLPGTVSRPLNVRLPEQGRLERSRLDGRTVQPLQIDGQLVFDLPGGPADAPPHELVVDYQETVDPSGSGSDQRQQWPELSLPSLSSVVILDAPEPARDTVRAPALESSDPESAESGLQRLLETWQTTPERPRDLEAISLFRARDRALGPWNSTLGERLTQLDSTDVPLVVDRQALEDAGLGPRSRPRFSSAPNERADGFGALGLVVVPVGEVLLVSTPQARPDQAGGPLDRPSSRRAWLSALREAAARGSSDTDRFQSVTRWRGAPTLETSLLDRPGDRLQHWAKVGSPPERFETERVSRLSETAWTVAVAGFVLGIGLVLRNRPLSWRLPALALALGSGLVALLGSEAEPAGWSSGLVVGSVATLAAWVGYRLRTLARRRPSASSSPSSTRQKVAGTAAAGGLILGVMVPSWGVFVSARESTEQEPILALMPYDQTPDPSFPGPRVVLRLSDFETLQALADSARPGESLPPISALGAEHRVEVLADDRALFHSTYDLVCESSASSSWSIPTGPGRDLSASLDGEPIPVRIEDQGNRAVVSLASEGRHRLVISRRLELLTRESLTVPLLPSALARISTQGQTAGRRLELSTDAGPLASGSETSSAWLGPARSLVLRWVEQDGEPQGTLGTVDGLLLWRVEPSGDRVIARLTYRNPDPRAEVRLALEPGLEVRSASFSGWRDASWEGTAEHPIWVAPATPPLPDGSVVTIELWRDAPAPDRSRQTTRSAPRIEALDVEADSGFLAVQVEPGWTARFDPEIPNDRSLQEIFLSSWTQNAKEPPRIEAILSWKSHLDLTLEAGPGPTRLSVRPSTRLEIERGRVSVSAELACEAASGPIASLDIAIPPAFQVVSVEAERLSAWTRPDADRLRLRFQSLDALDRTIRVAGWIPVAAAPLRPEARQRELALPWLSVAGASSEAGSLVIQAPPGVRPSLQDATGLTVVPSTSPLTSAPERMTYRTAGPSPTGTLVWTDDGPRANVSLVGHLLFRPGRVDWTCLVRYESLGGPTRSIRLKLPETWTESLQVESPRGEPGTSVTSDGDQSTLEIRLDTPIWGSRDLILRAHRPFHGARVGFPDVRPLGNGQVKTSIAWTDLTGWSLVAEGSAGIQPVDPSRFPSARLPVPSTSSLRVYQVLRGGWSLAFQAPGGEVVESGGSDSRTVSFADLECVLGLDGSLTGRARFLVEPGPAAFLSLRLPSPARPLSALVDGVSVRPLQDSQGRLLIPLGESPAPVVLLLWDHPSKPGAALASSGTLDLPTPTSGHTPCTLTLYAPSGCTLREPVSLSRDVGLAIEVERLEHATRRTLQSLSRFDRSALRDRSQLLSALVALELGSRSALRLAKAPSGASEPWSQELQRSLLQRISQSRTTLEETLRAGGLDDYLSAARSRVGLTPAEPNPERSEVTEPSSEFRLLRLGRPSWFRGGLDARSGPVSISWSRPPARSTRFDPRSLVPALSLLVVCLLLAWLTSGRRPILLPVAAALALVATIPLHLAPIAYAGLFVCLVIGAILRPSANPGAG